MRICFISPCDLSEESGGKTHTIEFAKNWSKFGHEVFLFSRGLKEKEAKNVNFHYINVPSIPFKSITLSFALFSVIKLIRYHHLFKFDVIYQRESTFNWSTWFAKLLRIPVVLELNDVPTSEIFIEKMSKAHRKLQKFILRPMILILRFNEVFTFRNVIKFVVTTQKIRKIEKYYNIKNKMHFIPFGANIELFRPIDKLKCREKINIHRNDKIICFVGSFIEWQGLEYIVKAMPMVLREMPNAKLLIVGDSHPKFRESLDLKQKLVAMTEELGLDNKIISSGRIPYENVPLYINASDACVVAQRPMRAGFSPFKLFEYMACGKPVVASDIEGVREIIKESGGGILVPPESPEKLAEAIVKLLKDEALMKRRGEDGLKCVVEKYSWEKVAGEAMKVCEEATEKGENYNEK